MDLFDLRVSQSLLRPTWSEVISIKSHIVARLMDVIHIPLNLHLASFGRLTPYRYCKSVVSIVVQDSRWDGKVNLVSDVWVETTILVTVDEQQSSQLVRRFGGRLVG